MQAGSFDCKQAHLKHLACICDLYVAAGAGAIKECQRQTHPSLSFNISHTQQNQPLETQQTLSSQGTAVTSVLNPAYRRKPAFHPSVTD